MSRSGRPSIPRQAKSGVRYQEAVAWVPGRSLEGSLGRIVDELNQESFPHPLLSLADDLVLAILCGSKSQCWSSVRPQTASSYPELDVSSARLLPTLRDASRRCRFLTHQGPESGRDIKAMVDECVEIICQYEEFRHPDPLWRSVLRQ